MSLAPTAHDNRPLHRFAPRHAARRRASASSANRRLRDRVSSDAVMAAYINDLAKPDPWTAAVQESEGPRQLGEEPLAA